MTRCLTCLAAVVCISLWMSACDQSPDRASAPTLAAIATSGNTPEPPPTTTEVPPTRRLTIAAVGDLMLGRTVGARVVADGPEFVFDDEVASVLRDADLTIGNLETSISERGTPADKGYTFRAPPLTTRALAIAGFDVVSLANNHSLDYGAEALADTFQHLNASGVLAVGAGPNRSAAHAPIVIERNGLRIAVLGLVDAPPEGDFNREAWEAQPSRPGVAWADEETVIEMVTQADAAADLVVLMIHFGVEFSATPSESQRMLARSAIDAGADLVIGSHPHVLQEVEVYRGGLIAYSLGNFVFDGFDGTANVSAILTVTVTADGVEAWKLIPVEIGLTGLPGITRP